MAYNIIVSSNERYMPGATVASVSVAVNACPESDLCFHIFTENVTNASFELLKSSIIKNHQRSRIVRHEMTDEQLKDLPYWAGSRMAAARCLYAEILDDVDWSLYLDCDVLYFASIEEHFSHCDDNKMALVIQEQSISTRSAEIEWIQKKCGKVIADEEYFNSGVILFNLKLMRKESIPSKLIEFFRLNSAIPSPDQDALNVVMAGRTKILPPKWNRLQIFLNDAALRERPVIHYVSGIPWSSRLGAVANGRFRLWHAFADNYVYGKRNESCKCCFQFKTVFFKRVIAMSLKLPVIGSIVAAVFEALHLVTNGRKWRETQIQYDVSRHAIQRILAKG